MYILFPGRHHILTAFQREYLARLIAGELPGTPPGFSVDGVVFAVTSANHDGTRRNPLPFHLRAVQVEAFGAGLGAPLWAYGIDDVGRIDDFAEYVIKKIQNDSDGALSLSPDNCVVLCSTPVLEQYEKLGFRVFTAELGDRATWTYRAALPWDCVERIVGRYKAAGDAWHADPEIRSLVHPASLELWRRYGLAAKTAALFDDAMLGDDGDLTETRDYNAYVRQMDEIADLKWAETGAFVRPGRIGDIGCAVGSWLKLAAADPRLHESDLYGIELSRPLYEICVQRKASGDFGLHDLFFARRNAIRPCFPPSSMDTVHSSSLTHEIFSYGSLQELRAFIAARYEELAPGGVWVNRDVIGPEDGARLVYAILCGDDGADYVEGDASLTPDRLSTAARFRRFVREWKPSRFPSPEGFAPREETVAGQAYAVCPLHALCDFALKKDYTKNWASEMHEAFCFWSYSDWRIELERAGFELSPASRAWRNDWIYENRIQGKVTLFERGPAGDLAPLAWPETHAVFVAGKGVLPKDRKAR